MNIAQAVLSGFVQGITEFFPISSSGHLVILHTLFGLKEPMLAFDIFLHFGTLIAVIIFFWHDIIALFRNDRRTLIYLIVSSIPTFIIAIIFKDKVEKLFASSHAVGYMLILTGIFLIIASVIAFRWKKTSTARPLGALSAIMIGIAQGLAIIPGISRSGATIATGLMLGLEERLVLKFSFLLSLPAVMGANLLKVREIYGNLIVADSAYFLIGGAAALMAGLFSIKALYAIVRRNLLFIFGLYCIAAGILVVTMISR